MEICLFQPEIAGNVGTIIRTAVCFGIKQIHIIMPTGFPFNTKELKRASMDYEQNITLTQHDSFESFIIKNTDKRIVLLTTKTNKSHTDFSYHNNDILMFGSESRGVNEEVTKKIDCKLKILISPNAR